MRSSSALAALLVGLAVPTSLGAAPISGGAGVQTADLGGVEMRVFTYRPQNCRIAGFLLVFHGVERNAADYRDHARPLADGLCLIAVAPLFDAERFPSWRYQRGGIVRDGRVLPRSEWTVQLVGRLVAWVRTEERRPLLPYTLIGHSAGAQFLARAAAFVPLAAKRIVIADPSTWVVPTTQAPAPWGFGGVWGDDVDPDGADDARGPIRRYLAQPITVLVGAEDTGERHLVHGEEADAQGANRLERARNVFDRARDVAAAAGLPFGWRYVEVPGIAHDAKKNFASPEALAALKP